MQLSSCHQPRQTYSKSWFSEPKSIESWFRPFSLKKKRLHGLIVLILFLFPLATSLNQSPKAIVRIKDYYVGIKTPYITPTND